MHIKLNMVSPLLDTELELTKMAWAALVKKTIRPGPYIFILGPNAK